MAAANNIRAWKVREEYWNYDLYGRLEVVTASIHLKEVVASIHLEAATTSKAARLRETLSTTSRMVVPYENPVT
jgi:hypothetical protein